MGLKNEMWFQEALCTSPVQQGKKKKLVLYKVP
jgi:hypothetical protein